ncbi:tyrosine-type recombinase/integrase [candidate division WWE3 bacterium]|nr:tyrosine-type recombinase/integrase [candidate division WWE3 bacterium]
MTKLEQAHKKFIDTLETQERSPSTVVAYKKDIEQLIEHLYKAGVNLVQEIKTIHLEDFMKSLAEKEYTNKSISRKTNSTKTFFRFLILEGLISENVADALKHPKVKIKAPRILSRLEYGALRDSARDDVRTFAIVEVLLQTGIRISELAKIKIEHLEMDLEKMLGALHIGRVGRHDARTIPLNKAVIEAINKYLQNERPKLDKGIHLFITKTGNPLLVRNIRATLTRYFETAGIENATVNDLRHTFVAHHLAQGTSITVISKIAGHKRLSTTERYLEFIERKTDVEKSELGVL